MADAGIKQYRQAPVDMPPISSINEGYTLRYRIISEDRNRVSHWSPVYLVIPAYTYVPDQISFNSANQIAAFTWDAVTVLKDTKTVQSIDNKELTSDIATLSTNGAHYMSVGDWVTVEGVDSTFNGTYKISAVTTDTFSYYKDSGNVVSTPVSPAGTYKTNAFIRNALQYDVWVRWDRNDGGDWLYKERIESTSLSLPHPPTYTINGAIQPSSPNKVSIEIYLVGEPVNRGDGIPLDTGTPFLKMYQLLNETI
jgi:hypothetical protein